MAAVGEGDMGKSMWNPWEKYEFFSNGIIGVEKYGEMIVGDIWGNNDGILRDTKIEDIQICNTYFKQKPAQVQRVRG